jgi:hypothetical protein
MKLFAPPEYWEIPKDTRDSWGCGPGGWGDLLVPDKILGLDVKPACQIHDFYYRHWNDPSEDARFMADRVFKFNMLRILANSYMDRTLRRKLSWVFFWRRRLINKYYLAVRRYGGPAWHDERNTEEEFKEEV